ncbi:hypothetical protein, partial [Nocardia puris]|uniref:hypothetical protein n=1 Tax=Nocardia puris TaxID=208602 RepID=UPI001B85BEEA
LEGSRGGHLLSGYDTPVTPDDPADTPPCRTQPKFDTIGRRSNVDTVPLKGDPQIHFSEITSRRASLARSYVRAKLDVEPCQ